jgi:hypothetical protein
MRGRSLPCCGTARGYNTVADNRMFWMSNVMGPAVAHVQSQRQEWSLSQDFDEFFGFHSNFL